MLISGSVGRLDGLFILQVDDSMILGTPEFSTKEDNAPKFFATRPGQIFGTDPIAFNGIHTRRNWNANIIIAQTDKSKRIRSQDNKTISLARGS